jgi:CheY-like chemotaxis protein
MPRVLIVDDKVENREVLVDFFRFFGRRSSIELEQAASGKEAVEKAVANKPDLVLMDINMETPYAGLDATSAIKAEYANSSIQVWAVTSQAMKGYSGEDSDEEKCLKAGCDKFVSKPYDQKELLFAISELLDVVIPDNVRQIFESNN